MTWHLYKKGLSLEFQVPNIPSLYGGVGDRSFEKSILDEVGIFGRGLYGTGLRA